jgi:hypothetical protein
MLVRNSQNKFAKFIRRIDVELILFFLGMAGLIYIGVSTHSLRAMLFSYIFFATIIGLLYFWRELLTFFFAPIFLLMWIWQHFSVKRYLRKNKFKINIPAETVVILGHSNWFLLEGWLKPIFFVSEIKQLVKTMRVENRNFSFYPNASLTEVEKIMSDIDITEVYFLGHGSSHEFQLGTDEILYYCDFNDQKYIKQFVHQVHCGDKYGKSLIDYVVPEENRARCFFFREPINGPTVIKELKKREEAAMQKTATGSKE